MHIDISVSASADSMQMVPVNLSPGSTEPYQSAADLLDTMYSHSLRQRKYDNAYIVEDNKESFSHIQSAGQGGVAMLRGR